MNEWLILTIIVGALLVALFICLLTRIFYVIMYERKFYCKLTKTNYQLLFILDEFIYTKF